MKIMPVIGTRLESIKLPTVIKENEPTYHMTDEILPNYIAKIRVGV